jgi:hypothetical protein
MTEIVTSDNAVRCTGEPLNAVWWQGKQWVVTSYVIEARNGNYCIEASRLGETRPGTESLPDWPMHMADKSWIDIHDFCTAFLVALALHGHGDDFTPDDLAEAIEFALGRGQQLQEWAAQHADELAGCFIDLEKETQNDKAEMDSSRSK